MTLLRDPGTGDYALEAGALVLGDQGRSRLLFMSSPKNRDLLHRRVRQNEA